MAWNGEHPSISAASSISFGISSRKLHNIQIEKGRAWT